MKNDILRRNSGEIGRALRNHKFERMPNGDIFLPASGLAVGGVFRAWKDGDVGTRGKNTTMLEYRNYNLNSAHRGAAQVTGWHIALFANDLAPVESLTGATFVATQNEFTNYTESTRRPWVTVDAVAQVLTNEAAPAQFTFNTGGGTVYGAAILQASAKGATTGLCMCAALFDDSQTLGTNGKLNVQYDFEAQDAE